MWVFDFDYVIAPGNRTVPSEPHLPSNTFHQNETEFIGDENDMFLYDTIWEHETAEMRTSGISVSVDPVAFRAPANNNKSLLSPYIWIHIIRKS
jgi:hypothetical protein